MGNIGQTNLAHSTTSCYIIENVFKYIINLFTFDLILIS